MAKTDDPVFDLQEQVEQLKRDKILLQDDIKLLKEYIGSINMFLIEKFPEELGGKGYFATSFWDSERKEKKRRDHQREWEIETLQAEGYFVTKNYEPPQAISTK